MTSVVPHPNSDKLYITQLDVGGGATRQVVAGLQKYVPIDALQGSLVMVVMNLKAARLAGEASEGMILAATAPHAEGETAVVQPIRPDAASQPGDIVYLEGQEAPADASAFPKQMKGDHWRKLVPELSVKDGAACYGDKAVMTSSGRVTAEGMPNGATIN